MGASRWWIIGVFHEQTFDLHKSDILNSTLLAQLFNAHDRYKQTDQRYKFYVNVLGKVGWVIQDVRFEEYTSHGETLKAITYY